MYLLSLENTRFTGTQVDLTDQLKRAYSYNSEISRQNDFLNTIGVLRIVRTNGTKEKVFILSSDWMKILSKYGKD